MQLCYLKNNQYKYDCKISSKQKIKSIYKLAIDTYLNLRCSAQHFLQFLSHNQRSTPHNTKLNFRSHYAALGLRQNVVLLAMGKTEFDLLNLSDSPVFLCVEILLRATVFRGHVFLSKYDPFVLFYRAFSFLASTHVYALLRQFSGDFDQIRVDFGPVVPKSLALSWGLVTKILPG